MKKAVLLIASFCVLQSSALFAADTDSRWQGYVTYEPKPVLSQVGLEDNDLKWMRDTAALLEPNAFTFLGRRDADHWMGLTRTKAGWLVQIHDETARFNFRATIGPRTGVITVERGVDWSGMDRQADANEAARMAVGYVQRARQSLDLFPVPNTEKPKIVEKPAMAEKPTMAEKPAMSEKPTMAELPDAMLGKGGMEQWQKLVDGNLRFVSGTVLHPNQSQMRITETAKGQKPFAIVVSCSDSRVPPEILFDQGLGDLFVVRTAGEVVTEVELGSIEYAVEHLGAHYLVVLGHKKCGAVDATLKGGDLPPNIEAIAAQIRPAVEASRFFKGDPLDNAVRENAKLVLAKIKTTPALAQALREGQLNLKAAYYDIDSGKVAALP